MFRALLQPYWQLDRRLWLLTLARCVNVMGFSVVMPFMALYLLEQRGLMAKTYGALYFAAGIIAAFSQAQAGAMADAKGRKKVIVHSLCWRALNMLGLGAAVSYHAPLWVIGLLILSNGYLRARVEPAVSAAVTDLTSPEHRVAAFGLQRVGINLGWALGPALGGMFVKGTYGLMFCFAAPLLLVAAYAASKVGDAHRPLPATRTSEAVAFQWDVWPTVWANRPFFWYLVLTFFASILTAQMFATMSIYARLVRGLDERSVGLLYTVNGLLVVVLQAPGVMLIRKYGPRVTLFVGPLLFSIGFFAYGYATAFASFALVTAILTFGEVLFSPAQNDMAAELGDKTRLGRSFGLFGFASSLGTSLGPLFGGTVFDTCKGKPVLLWSIIGGAMGLLTLCFTAFSRTYVARPLRDSPTA
jgi:MFS family permease